MEDGRDRPANKELAISAECDLAERLHWLEEKFNPSLEADPGWAELCERRRLYYRAVIRDLARYNDLWELVHRG